MDGLGGCPNVGGICIGCTMPGFPDKFMPFMDEPPGGTVSSTMTKAYGAMIRRLRSITNDDGKQGTQVAPQQAGAHDRLQPALAELGEEGST